MILRRIQVENFRCHNVAIDIAFDERLTIVAGLNEAGKTTIFEALQYALFRRSSATGKDIEALTPWDKPGLSPAVCVDFEHDGAEYKLYKNWGRRGGTELSKRTSLGSFAPDMAENADDFLATVFAGQPSKQGQFSGFTGQHMGLAYLLFVPQASVPIAGDAKVIGLHTDARARLTEILDAATQSPEAARLGKLICAAYDSAFTSKGVRRRNAEATRTIERIESIKVDIEATRARLRSFEAFSEELTSAKRQLAAAATLARAAKSAAALERPRYQLAVAFRATLQKAEADLQATKAAYDDLIEETRLQEDAQRRLDELKPKRETLASRVMSAEQACFDAEDQQKRDLEARATAFDPEIENLESNLLAARESLAIRQQVRLLEQQIQRAKHIVDRLAEIESELGGHNRVTRSDVDRLRQAVEADRRIQTQLEGVRTSLAFIAARELSIAWKNDSGAGEKLLGAGEHFTIDTDSQLLLRIEGFGQIDVRGPVSDAHALRAELVKCQAALLDLVRCLGTGDPLELQQRLTRADTLDSERTQLLAQRDEVLSGKRLVDVKSELERQQSLLKSRSDFGSLEELEALIASRQEKRAALIAELDSKVKASTNLIAVRRDALAAARGEKLQVDEEWLRLEIRASQKLRQDTLADDREKPLRAAYALRIEAERKVADAREAYAPYANGEDPVAELTRVQELADQRLQAEMNAESSVREVEAKLADAYDEAPEPRLIELEEELARLSAQLTDQELSEGALKLIHDFVVDADAKRVESFARPLLERVAPWFKQVTGHELLGLDLSSDNEVNGLRLGGVDRAIRFDELSQGTCDQLALLIRLAFASLLTSPECLGPMPVVLDDPLVHADWERRPRFCKILEQVSSSAQVIVFTCRPEDYQGIAARFVNINGSQNADKHSAA